jgi:demethylmenaquinone methyltransferase/2-methoxy-6-polyprenyl-1,4-benzoquinol methylase
MPEVENSSSRSVSPGLRPGTRTESGANGGIDVAWDDDLLKSPHAVGDKRRRVREMFAAIAPSYDLNNRLHSLWVDQFWRRKAVKLAELKTTDDVVDVACGTGDLSLKFSSSLLAMARRQNRVAAIGESLIPSPVTGIDFTFAMLRIALNKTPSHRWSCIDLPDPAKNIRFSISTSGPLPEVCWVHGDAQALPLPDACADVVSIAFGIRNVQDPAIALAEFRRVLRPGGRLIILEFSLPTNRILRGLYNFYFRQILPRTATLISGDKTGAYKYLPRSVNTFIGREQMMGMMSAAGFERVEQFPMTFGVCVCYRGVVPGI